MTKIEKDDILNIGNNLDMDVYADEKKHSGRDYKHTVSGNALIEVGKELKQHAQKIRLTGSTNVKVLGKAGTIIV